MPDARETIARTICDEEDWPDWWFDYLPRADRVLAALDAAGLPILGPAIVRYLGELYAAALHDAQTSPPESAEWRRAYLDGCKDMVEGIVTRIPDATREAVRGTLLAIIEKERAALSTPPADREEMDRG